MPSTKLILLAALLLGWLLRVSGTTWHVAENGSDDNDGLSWRTALANPQSAIDRAHSGDCVLIGTGKYYATHILETDSDSVYA